MKPTQTARTNAMIDGGDRQAAAYELRARHDAELTSCEFGDLEVCGAESSPPT
jgi:hypothetical protein